MDPRYLLAASASIVGLMGSLHLLLTYRGPKLLPRDRSLIEAMASTPPVITRQTNFWKLWIGFNASHSLGAILFGLVYGYLALARPEVLFGSPFLEIVGAATLIAFVVLARRYWFATPLAGASVALVLYLTGLAIGSV